MLLVSEHGSTVSFNAIYRGVRCFIACVVSPVPSNRINVVYNIYSIG